jgi:TonB family protein
LIQTKESRRQVQTQDKVEDIVLPSICASFLAEEFSLWPYLAWSHLFSILLFAILFFYNSLQIEPDRKKQIIDIEFLSATDFKNKDDLLPATLPKLSLGKRVSPTDHSLLPKTFTLAVESDPQHQEAQQREFTYAINCQQRKSADALNCGVGVGAALAARTRPLDLRVAKATLTYPMVSPVKQALAEMQLEEVAPLAMTEVKDNDGDNSLELWQDGGRSNEGLGAPSALANYLKGLHKKLKHTWSPPPGQAHRIKVLFRLAANGGLVSLKLVVSSGDTNADNSALEAVNKAAPFGKLPQGYPSHFLDLAYTFNYSTDELSEVAPPIE